MVLGLSWVFISLLAALGSPPPQVVLPNKACPFTRLIPGSAKGVPSGRRVANTNSMSILAATPVKRVGVLALSVLVR